MRITRQRTFTYIGALLVCGALLAGCGGSSDSSTQSSGGSAADSAENLPAAPAPADAGGAATGKDQAAKAPDLSVEQRSIIYTGSITVRVDDVNASAARAIGIATAAGGFVGGDNRSSGSGSDTASLTLRVPAPRFSAVVDELAKLGEEEDRGINTEDVTEATIDLDARITVQQARVDSGRRLLSQAKSLNDLVMLENEVATRESDLASLQAKKRRLADLTALSTITVVLLDPAAERVTGDDGPPGFLAGLTGGWNALKASLAVLVTVLGAVLPWLIALGLPIWAIIWAFRRFARTRPARATPTAFAPLGPPLSTYPPNPGPAHRSSPPPPPTATDPDRPDPANPTPAQPTPAQPTPAQPTPAPDGLAPDGEPDGKPKP